MATAGPPVAAQPGTSAGTKPALSQAHGSRNPPVAPSEHTEQKRDLTSWWRSFKRIDKKEQVPQGIFGVPLSVSVGYANVAISLFDDDDKSYIYGYVPIVVAKCGVYLKEKATDVEGIFRLAGSEKRIKELKSAFDSPDRYGKGLDWTGYTVHDAANILRRYFNQLPEPIIPLEFYDKFRRPITGHQAEAVGNNDSKTPGVGGFMRIDAIRVYQALITEIPPLNRQLLLYILDLLAVFASKSDLNKMTTANLSAIFQPGILSHPQHDMAPEEYRLSQDVLIFLIENQDHFLIGMQGTAADPETVRAVQSGASAPKTPSTPTTPTRSKTIIGRSSSNASAGAESIRKWGGGPRRNVSVSSKHSKQSEVGPMPLAATATNPSTPTSGVHRSNTVPSRPGAGTGGQSPRFVREKSSDSPTPPTSALASGEVAAISRSEPLNHAQVGKTAASSPRAPPEVISPSSSEATTPLAGARIGSEASSVFAQVATPRKDTTPLLGTLSVEQPVERTASITPSANSGHGFLGFLKQSPSSDGDGRKPNKLQKKRVPGSSLSSAQSSTQDLPHDGAHDLPSRSPISSSFGAPVHEDVSDEYGSDDFATPTTQSTPIVPVTPQRHVTDSTLRPTVSPTHSYQSQTDQSDADLVGDDMPAHGSEQPDREKKRHRWRLSRAQNKLSTPGGTVGGNDSIGTTQGAREQTSRSTFASSQPRRSFQEPPVVMPESNVGQSLPQQSSQPLQTSNTDPVFSDSEKEKKGPMSWIRGKIQERKDKDAEKRSKTPERNRERAESKQDVRLTSSAQEVDLPLPVRGKSIEQTRLESNTTAPTATALPPTFGGNVPQNSALSGTTMQQIPEARAVVAQVPPITTAPVPASAASTTPLTGGSRPGTALTAAEFIREAERAQLAANAAAASSSQK